MRSVHIEKDLNDLEVAKGYVLTTQARLSLDRILNGLNGLSSNRAWTITGPYGSGKSYFGVFISNLVSVDLSAHQHALKLLDQTDHILADKAKKASGSKKAKGLLVISINGFRAHINICIQTGLLNTLEKLTWVEGINEVIERVKSWTINTNSREIIEVFQTLLEIIDKPNVEYSGLILIIDEMGKVLEYLSANPEQGDVYLLQELAELANRTNQTKFLLICILHQAFERYAAFLDGVTQREWSKVQGRFEDIPFQEPPHQQIWLLSAALNSDETETNKYSSILRDSAEKAISGGWLPPLLSQEDYYDLAVETFPLHPTALTTLVYLFRKLAQNERSIFVYLGSHEPFGFQEFIHNNYAPSLIRLPDLFDYITANFQARLYSSGRARSITETLERINSNKDLEGIDIYVLKVIGLINWLNEVSDLKATHDSIVSALQSHEYKTEDIEQSIERLLSRSMIVFRRFSHSYVIWQGSDVDIEDRIFEAQHHLSKTFNIAEEVNKYISPKPIVARRSSYQSGSMRYFDLQYISIGDLPTARLDVLDEASGLVLLGLPGNSSEVEAFRVAAENEPFSIQKNLVIGIVKRTLRLNELLHELRCLHWVRENTPELRDDPIARRELNIRTMGIESIIQTELSKTFSLHKLADSEECVWYHLGKKIIIKKGVSISHLLSEVCDILYPQSPRIWNELINRRQVSSQAAAARRKLIEAMLTSESKDKLGITGFPPERSMYESLLLDNGIHHKDANGNWKLSAPRSGDKNNLKPVWDAIHQFIFDPPVEQRSIEDLYEIMKISPYGLLDGVIPIIFCAFMTVNGKNTTLYREGSLIPEPGIADWEIFIRRPELYSVAGCVVTGQQAAILERFARGLKTEAATMPVVRALIQNVKRLPEFAWRTQRLHKHTLIFRKAIDQAHSPERLLFKELPEAFELTEFGSETINDTKVNQFFDELNKALKELADATPVIRLWARDEFLSACELPASELGWGVFIDEARHLVEKVVNPNLLPLLKRASEAMDHDQALDSVLAFIANRPLHSWSDVDVDRFPSQANYYGKSFIGEREGNPLVYGLNEGQFALSQEIAADLANTIEEHSDDPKVLIAALQQLIRKLSLKSKN